jgi:mannose-6-phosphate isomerase-like protein (cupin superfamily)
MGNGIRVLMVACVLCTGCNRRTEGTAQADPAKRGGAATAPTQRYQAPIMDLALHNQDYRHVVFTGTRMQLVLMSIPPGGDIGEETHARVEQALFCVAGSGVAVLNGVESRFAAGDAVVVTMGTRHNFRNTGKEPLQLYTVYSPPNHIDGRVQRTKLDADQDRADEEFGRRVEGP